MTGAIKTLIVDDEKNIRLFLRKTLERSGQKVTSASSGEEALAILQDNSFDLAVLDLKLGGQIDGQRILEAIRWRWPATVVVILTAHGSFESALEAIQENIDAYLEKPLRPAALRQAIEEAFHRRDQLLDAERTEDTADFIEAGPFRVDLTRHLATRDGVELGLSDREFKLLVYLMRQAPEVVGPKELVRVVRQYEPEHLQEAREIIKWYIHSLRQKIEPEPENPHYIINVHSVGYRFSS